MDLKEIIKSGESETIEIKSSLSETKQIIETLSAFSNTKGGTIVIGVSDKGEFLGIGIGKKTIESLANKIKQNTDPMVYPLIRVEKTDDKWIVLIEIEESKQKPRNCKSVGKSKVYRGTW